MWNSQLRLCKAVHNVKNSALMHGHRNQGIVLNFGLFFFDQIRLKWSNFSQKKHIAKFTLFGRQILASLKLVQLRQWRAKSDLFNQTAWLLQLAWPLQSRQSKDVCVVSANVNDGRKSSFHQQLMYNAIKHSWSSLTVILGRSGDFIARYV